MSRAAETTTAASSPSGFNSLALNSSMDQILAPSMEEPVSPNKSNDADQLNFMLQDDLKAAPSANNHSLSSAEEKKVDESTISETPSYDDNPPVNNSSFERALGEIENEFEDKDYEFADDRQERKSDSLTSSTMESKRYNDILGLLRNRRQELTAALRKQPGDLAAQSSDEIGNELVEVTTKSSDEGDTAVVSVTGATKSDEGKHKEGSADSDETAATSNLEKKAELSNSDEKTAHSCTTEESNANQLERIESAPQETEDERRRRQQTTTPTRRHPVDLNSLSPTPPRSPQRSLPYFHKPSGMTPPASPTFLTGLGTKSPPRKARLDLSPNARSEDSASPRASSPATMSPKGIDSSPSARVSGAPARDLPTLPPLMTSIVQQDGSPKTTSHRLPESPQSETDKAAPSSYMTPRSISPPSKNLDTAAIAARNALPRSSLQKGSPFRASGGHSPRKYIPPDKIRFRDPYPILRPEKQPRDPEVIIAEHITPKEQDPIRWVRPKPDLKQLIVAAMGTSLARRSNACGALKVLTKSKKNQINLFRTDSFMSSLLFCASQDIPVKERDVALDARTRAVSCIKAVCEPKMNRYHAITFPGLLDCLAKVIQTDNGESRSLACGALALIAKTSDCREEIAKDFRLVRLLAQVLGNRVPVSSPVKEDKVEYPSSPLPDEHTDDEDDEHSDNSGIAEESTIADYDTAFAGSMGMLESFDMLSRNNPNSPNPQSDEEGTVEDRTVTSYESENDQPAVDSIRKKNLERNQTFVQESRASACAVLLHLSRECALSVSLLFDICRREVVKCKV